MNGLHSRARRTVCWRTERVEGPPLHLSACPELPHGHPLHLCKAPASVAGDALPPGPMAKQSSGDVTPQAYFVTRNRCCRKLQSGTTHVCRSPLSKLTNDAKWICVWVDQYINLVSICITSSLFDGKFQSLCYV